MPWDPGAGNCQKRVENEGSAKMTGSKMALVSRPFGVVSMAPSFTFPLSFVHAAPLAVELRDALLLPALQLAANGAAIVSTSSIPSATARRVKVDALATEGGKLEDVCFDRDPRQLADLLGGVFAQLALRLAPDALPAHADALSSLG